VEVLAPGGFVVLRVHEKAAVPEDPRWAVARRTAVGSTAYVLLERRRAAPPPTPGE
jgi:hypothetical protein